VDFDDHPTLVDVKSRMPRRWESFVEGRRELRTAAQLETRRNLPGILATPWCYAAGFTS